jgi:peptidyl-prolyl cis-trans isomerase SurA
MRSFLRSSSVLLASSLVLVAGCHKGPADGVVATVNGHPILRTDMDKIYDAQMAQNPQGQTSSDQVDAAKLQILQTLIVEEIVEQRAAKENLTATDAEVDAKLAEMKASYTEEQFAAKLKASNLTLDELKHDLRRSLTQNKLLNKEINSKITVTDADVSTYFDAHKAEFNLPDNEYHLAQIIVTAGQAQNGNDNLQNSKATSDADAKKKIQALKNRLDAGDDFGVLAMNFSENPQTAPNGGDMGMIPEQQLKTQPIVYGAVSKLHAGQNTDIIPFPDASDPHKVGGYAIFRLIEKAAAGQRDLSDPRVQQQIRKQLQDSRSQLLKAAYLEMLRDQSKIDNFYAEQIFKDTAK